MGQPSRHLAETLEVVFQRHLFAQLGDFSDVSQQAWRASWTTLRRQLDRRDRGAEPSYVSVRTDRLNLRATINRSRLQTITDHLRELFVRAEEFLIRLAERCSVSLE